MLLAKSKFYEESVNLLRRYDKGQQQCSMSVTGRLRDLFPGTMEDVCVRAQYAHESITSREYIQLNPIHIMHTWSCSHSNSSKFKQGDQIGCQQVNATGVYFCWIDRTPRTNDENNSEFHTDDCLSPYQLQWYLKAFWLDFSFTLLHHIVYWDLSQQRLLSNRPFV